MKLATFAHPEGPRIGIVDTARGLVLDLRAAAGSLGRAMTAFDSMLSLIEAGAPALAATREVEDAWPASASLSLDGVRLLAPLPRPQQIRDCLVFEQHLVNAQKQWEKMTGRAAAGVAPLWYERPTWYKGNRFSVVGHDTEVQWPSYSELMDFELELACVIGTQGRDIEEADALDHVFGFTIFNDFSARDVQVDERPLGMGPMKGKDFDTGNVFGPWIVTRDEIGDPQALSMTARVNGETWGGGSSADMHHSFAKILAFVSVAETLYPGEIIASGTVPTGCGLELGRFLSPGDVVELEVSGIGVLRNRIVRPT